MGQRATAVEAYVKRSEGRMLVGSGGIGSGRCCSTTMRVSEEASLYALQCEREASSDAAKVVGFSTQSPSLDAFRAEILSTSNERIDQG